MFLGYSRKLIGRDITSLTNTNGVVTDNLGYNEEEETVEYILCESVSYRKSILEDI